jgi:heme ABC exporter ATP-binding subunit CcmA
MDVAATSSGGPEGAAVRLEEAVVLLGRFPALAGVDMVVSPGEIVLLQGANGAGKTTVLRLCAGLLPLSGGRASVLGHDLAVERTAVRGRVGLLGHANGLYDELTVADNVQFWARAGGATDPEIAAAMDRLGLSGRLAAVPAGRLSAGQRRRTALAVLVARRPELWLLDEPHAGLDAGGRDLFDALVRDAVAAGATVLFASHELDRALELAHRVVTIAGGRAAPAPEVLNPTNSPSSAPTGAPRGTAVNNVA